MKNEKKEVKVFYPWSRIPYRNPLRVLKKMKNKAHEALLRARRKVKAK